MSRQINTLALLHGVVPEVRREQVERVAFTEGEEDVVQFGSPFATFVSPGTTGGIRTNRGNAERHSQ